MISCECDICKKTFHFDKNKEVHALSFYKRDLASVISGSYGGRVTGEQNENLDLCPECFEQIKGFIIDQQKMGVKDENCNDR